jgi:CheY-like chemotaxis protein
MPAPQATVLCIDDTATDAEACLLRSVLKKAGYQVLIARDAQEALATIRAHHIDLVLTEHIMPAPGGPSLAEEVKQLNPHLAVVVYSGTWEAPGGAASGDKFITKLAPIEELLRTIQALLEAVQSRAAA